MHSGKCSKKESQMVEIEILYSAEFKLIPEFILRIHLNVIELIFFFYFKETLTVILQCKQYFIYWIFNYSSKILVKYFERISSKSFSQRF